MMSDPGRAQGLLAEYALGLLEPDETRELESELANSSELRAALDAIEESLDLVASAETTPALPSDRLRSQLLEAATGGVPVSRGYSERLARLFELSVSKVEEIARSLLDVGGSGWTTEYVDGTHLLHFDGGRGLGSADCGLVHVLPGVEFPAHRHLGDESSLVLSGRGREDSGRVMLPGDFIFKPVGSEHSFAAEGDEPFVFAVVLHEGLEMREA